MSHHRWHGGRPNPAVVFWSFRLMVGIGFAMLGIGAWSLWARYRKRLYTRAHGCGMPPC